MRTKLFLLFTMYLPMIFSGTGVSGDYYYPLHDHLGSVRVVVDTGANVVESYDYYPFGAEQRSRVNANQNAGLRFTGKELDKESHLGLYYFGARYYDPEVGRFLSVDPLTDKYPGWTPYHYAANNPLMFVDPDGKEIIPQGAMVKIHGTLMERSSTYNEKINEINAKLGEIDIPMKAKPVDEIRSYVDQQGGQEGKVGQLEF
jgi:RHS repeat-associated protein